MHIAHTHTQAQAQAQAQSQSHEICLVRSGNVSDDVDGNRGDFDA